MKRILISLENPDLKPWNRFSAVASVIRSIAEILSGANYEVYINQYPYAEVLANAKSIANSGNSPTFRMRLYRAVPKQIREFVKDILLFRKLKADYKVIATIPKPDLILSWISYGSANGSKLAKYWGIPLVSIYDNPLNDEYHFQTGVYSLFRKLIDLREGSMLRSSQAIIVYSPAMASHLSNKWPSAMKFEYKQFIDNQKLNFISREAISNPINIVFIGSFFKWHKIESLLSVFARVKSHFLNTQLFLVGDGPERPAIEQLVKTHPFSDAIQLKGLMDKDELNGFLKGMHIGVIPHSLWFHAPLKLFQYAAAGIGIVCYRTPTIDFIVGDSQKSFGLFESDMAMYERIMEYVLHPDSILENGRLAQRLLHERYSSSEYLRFFESVFSSSGISNGFNRS